MKGVWKSEPKIRNVYTFFHEFQIALHNCMQKTLLDGMQNNPCTCVHVIAICKRHKTKPNSENKKLLLNGD